MMRAINFAADCAFVILGLGMGVAGIALAIMLCAALAKAGS